MAFPKGEHTKRAAACFAIRVDIKKQWMARLMSHTNNHEVTKMVRFYTPSLYGACDALDLHDIDYDLDDGDRIMVDDSLYDAALDAFEEYDIEYEEV